jgi:hypothetical protein
MSDPFIMVAMVTAVLAVWKFGWLLEGAADLYDMAHSTPGGQGMHNAMRNHKHMCLQCLGVYDTCSGYVQHVSKCDAWDREARSEGGADIYFVDLDKGDE